MAAFTLPGLNRLSTRERRVLAIGGVIAVLLLVLVVVLPLERNVATLQRTVAHKRAELAWMRRVAPQLAAAAPASANATLPLIVLIDQSARRAGLAGTLNSTTPQGADALHVQLQRAPFDALITWLARLEQRDGIEVSAARIEAADGPGLVNAGLTLKRP